MKYRQSYIALCFLIIPLFSITQYKSGFLIKISQNNDSLSDRPKPSYYYFVSDTTKFNVVTSSFNNLDNQWGLYGFCISFQKKLNAAFICDVISPKFTTRYCRDKNLFNIANKVNLERSVIRFEKAITIDKSNYLISYNFLSCKFVSCSNNTYPYNGEPNLNNWLYFITGIRSFRFNDVSKKLAK